MSTLHQVIGPHKVDIRTLPYSSKNLEIGFYWHSSVNAIMWILWYILWEIKATIQYNKNKSTLGKKRPLFLFGGIKLVLSVIYLFHCLPLFSIEEKWWVSFLNSCKSSWKVDPAYKLLIAALIRQLRNMFCAPEP